ncbi:MAG: hypothetical protein NWS00_01740, partial [Opitutales bacterium]|nr:hypothetical protein [Opitutales bacterium]
IEELLCKVKTGEISNPDVSTLAPMVIQLAETGVSDADDILNRAAQELVRAVVVTHRKSKLKKAPLILMGGLLDKSEFFRKKLIDTLQVAEPAVHIQKRLMSPIVGAVVVACKKSNDGLPPELEKVLVAELAS